jgi:hypothetical protein
MWPVRRQEFLGFARARTPELFGVAYALAGRQDAAEKLLQAALERTYLRWRRLDDPYDFTVRAMRRLRLPWWRRWQRLRDDPPVTEPGRGRVVDVSDLALVGARRRRAARVGLAAGGLAAVVALAIAVPAGLPQWLSPDAAADGRPSPELAGQLVVASYEEGTQGGTNARALNPETGEYGSGGSWVSPDLRWGVQWATGEAVRLISTTTGGLGELLDWPAPAGTLAWSPDSTRIAATASDATPPHASSLAEQFGAVMILDVAERRAWHVPLDLPDDRVGVHLFWLDEAHLAVPVADPAAPAVHSRRVEYELPGEGSFSISGQTRPVVDEVLVVNLDGAVVGQVPVNQGDYHSAEDTDLVWLSAGSTADGSLLFAREPADGLLELTTVDPGSGDAGPVMTVTVPGPPDDYLRVPRHLTHAVQALPGGLVLLRSQLLMATSHPDFDDAPSGHLSFRYEYHLLDPPSDRIWSPELPDLPDGALIRTIGDAAWLSPAAAHRAFLP